MKVFTVDVSRKEDGFYATVQKIIIETGQMSQQFIDRGRYAIPLTQIVNELFDLVVMEMPDKIVFDERSFGLSIKEGFIDLVNKSKCIKYNSNDGTVTYKTNKIEFNGNIIRDTVKLPEGQYYIHAAGDERSYIESFTRDLKSLFDKYQINSITATENVVYPFFVGYRGDKELRFCVNGSIIK